MSTEQDKSTAALLRRAATIVGRHSLAAELTAEADRRDPPAAEYADGTLAQISYRYRYGIGEPTVYVRRRHGCWVGASGNPVVAADCDVTSVEVIPTVPEGHRTYNPETHVAVERLPIRGSLYWKSRAKTVGSEGHEDAALVIRAYAAALEAEATS